MSRAKSHYLPGRRAGRCYNFWQPMTTARHDALSDLRALSDAGITLTSELSLQAVLQKVVQVAKKQIGATYAALSVLGPDGNISQFITEGVTEEERTAIGSLPAGRGFLGILLHKGETLRVSDIAADPRGVGFPPNHPAMKSLLGVPLVFSGRIIGNLYLTDKVGGSFDDRDEEIVRLLASQAAVAIRNAELYEGEQRRAEEWKALFELGQQVTASPRMDDVMRSVVSRASDLLGTDVVALMLLSPDGAHLRLAAQEGVKQPDMRKLTVESEAALQKLALELGEPLVVADFPNDPRVKGQTARLAEAEGLVSMIVVPLKGKRGPIGTLMVANRSRTEFAERQVELLEAFANWTALALESSQLYDKMESLARLEERERIGMDLHDGVMQSIYAVGLHLEDCIERLKESPSDAEDGIERAIDTLNNVIKDIRSYIFDLRPRVSVVADLPDAVRQLVDDVRVNTLMETSFETAGSVRGLINQNEAIALFHIAQEALNNVIKHSRATSVSVRLTVDKKSVTIEVRDNGVGIDPARAASYERHGLRNMRDRARSVGAGLSLDSRPGEGTTVRAELPLRPKEEGQ